MRFQTLVAIAAITQITSLRQEAARSDLEVEHEEQAQLTRETEKQFRLPAVVPAEAEGFFEERVELTYESCADGVVKVNGQMVVKKVLYFSKDCRVLRGEPDSEVVLEAPLEFAGSLRFEGDLRLRAASAFQGPCIHIGKKANMVGNLFVSDCRNEDDFLGKGGGLYVWGALEQRSGTVEFHNCSSKYGKGGGLFAESSLTQHGGTLQFIGCSSGKNGGGLYVDYSLTQRGGTLQFTGCSSRFNGGGLHASLLTQHGGTLQFNGCSGKNGGGMFVFDKYIAAGVSVFDSCAATKYGGGLYVMQFEQATAGQASFKQCTAMRGGGIYAIDINATQTIHFSECEAAQSGGGIQIAGEEGQALNMVTFESCRAARGTAIEARNLTVQQVHLVDTFQKAIDAQSLQVSKLIFTVKEPGANGTKPAAAIEAMNMTIASNVNCTPLRSCEFIASSPPNIGNFFCPLGTGVPMGESYGCLACPEGYTQIETETSGSCVACPNGTALCRAAKIQMAPGLMIHDLNLNRPLHCPTKAACRGGELPVTSSRPMCQPAYSGEGCSQCARGNGALYLTADSSVLSCTLCANNVFSQILQWFAFLAQRCGLFAVAAASVLGAGRPGRADRAKNSGVFLNQLMSFAAVASSVVTAVMHTATAQKMKTAMVEGLFGAAALLSETGSGQGSRSAHCLLSYISLEDAGLYGVHVLDIGIAALLVVVLSIKDFRVALVAGINCFLPRILADFAKYGVCFTMEEEDRAGGHAHLICKYLPFQGIFGFVTVGVGFVTVLAGALFVWIRLSTAKEDDAVEEVVQAPEPVGNNGKFAQGSPSDSPLPQPQAAGPQEVPSHQAWLTRKYKKECRYFETERLVRKVLLATAAAFFPSSSFPEQQMTSLTIIIIVSVFLYGNYTPYRQQSWNRSELGLLLLALLLIALASAVMAHEEKWNKTELGQQSMIISLGVIVTAVCSGFMIKILLEVWRERRPAQAAPQSQAAAPESHAARV